MRSTSEALQATRRTSAVPTVFVVDDDVSVLESLQSLIRHSGWQAETFTCAEDFLARSRICGPCCMLLDLSLPGIDGLDLQSRIAADRSDLPIIFVTGHGDIPTSVRAMKGGAQEFLTKPLSVDAVLSAVRSAIDHSRTASQDEETRRELKARYESLSAREREVMALVVSGLLNKQVGGELGISEITVKAHRGRVMRKMNAKSLARLVNMYALLRPMLERDRAGSD